MGLLRGAYQQRVTTTSTHTGVSQSFHLGSCDAIVGRGLWSWPRLPEADFGDLLGCTQMQPPWLSLALGTGRGGGGGPEVISRVEFSSAYKKVFPVK